jgi:hypothetical protein
MSRAYWHIVELVKSWCFILCAFIYLFACNCTGQFVVSISNIYN